MPSSVLGAVEVLAGNLFFPYPYYTQEDTLGEV